MKPEIVPEKTRSGILIISSSFPKTPESFEGNFVFELARRFDSKVIRPIVLAPHFPGGLYEEQWSSVSICRFRYFFPTRFEQLAYGSGIAYNLRENPLLLFTIPLFFISEFFAALRIILNNPISLIHTHWLLPQGLIGAFLHRFTGIPHIATIHGSDLNLIKKYSILHPVCRYIVRNSDTVTVNSSYMQRQLQEIAPGCEEKTRVIPMGVDSTNLQGLMRDDVRKKYSGHRIIISVGRLIDWKGTKYLVEAMPEILKSVPNALLIIIGTGPESRRLEQKICDLGLQDHVILAGFVKSKDLPSYYHAADVFVLPSVNIDRRTEGLGVVLLEAMASGCPVIGSNVGGIPDIITDGENGFLIPERDPQALAEKIVEIVLNKSLTDKFHRNGEISIKEKFSWDVIAQKFSNRYEDAINSRKERTTHH